LRGRNTVNAALQVGITGAQGGVAIRNILSASKQNTGGGGTAPSNSGGDVNPGTVAPVIQGSATQTQAIQDVRVTNQNQVPIKAYITNRELQTNEQRTRFLNNISSF